MPDSGQDNTTDSNDGFLVAATCFGTAITVCKFRMFLRLNKSIFNLHQNRFIILSLTVDGKPGVKKVCK